MAYDALISQDAGVVDILPQAGFCWATRWCPAGSELEVEVRVRFDTGGHKGRPFVALPSALTPGPENSDSEYGRCIRIEIRFEKI